jgi:hypothetical protein
MPSITCSPSPAVAGKEAVLTGAGFIANHQVKITVYTLAGVAEENDQTTDASGAWSSDAVAVRASVTLTSDATNVAAAETVTVGAVTYTFRASVGSTANEVLVGADAATSLANLKSAINLDGSAVYGTSTVIHPTVGASTITATTLLLYAKTGGTGGNSLASTETSAHLSFGTTTLIGGAAAPSNAPMIVTPQSNQGGFTVIANDGTSTVTLTTTVFSE